MTIRGSQLELQHAYEPSRLFVRASSEYARIASAPLTNVPIAMGTWIFPADVANTEHVMDVSVNGSLDGWWLRLRGNVVGDPVEFQTYSGSGVYARTTTGYSINTWHYIFGMSEATDSRSVSIDGGSWGTDATARADPAVDCANIGRLETGTNYFDGRVFWPCIWNAMLTHEEVAALANRQRPTPPWKIRPESIVAMPNMRTLWDPYMKARWTPTGTRRINAPFYHYPRHVALYPIAAPPLAPAFAITRHEEGGFIRYHVAWTTDGTNTIDEWIPWSLDGTLHAISFTHADAGVVGANYSVKIFDPLDGDVLDGLMASASYNNTNRIYLRHDIASGRIMPISVMGRHRIEIDTGSDDTWGEFDLYLIPRIVDRFADGGAHQ